MYFSLVLLTFTRSSMLAPSTITLAAVAAAEASITVRCEPVALESSIVNPFILEVITRPPAIKVIVIFLNPII